MVRLRLTRMGRKKRPFYRIVAADSRAKRDGRHIEILGYYDPMTEPSTIKLDLDRVDYWMGVGASPSETVTSLIKRVRSGADGVVQMGVEPAPVEVPTQQAEPAADGPAQDA